MAKLEPVCNAGYQAGHHDKCLPGTRESVLQDLLLWAKNPQDRNVFWLNGLAGTGKSTIAQSFSEAVAKQGLLGAVTFSAPFPFFSRLSPKRPFTCQHELILSCYLSYLLILSSHSFIFYSYSLRYSLTTHIRIGRSIVYSWTSGT